MSILAFIFVMGVVILVHELGHFVAGLLVHAKIEEFNIGMGPKVLSKKFKGIEYCLRALPLGGSVNFGSAYEEVPAGGEDETELKPVDDPDNLNNKSILQRIFVFAAGPFMNFVLAILIFAGFFMSYGAPTADIQDVVADSPAYTAGFQPGDIVEEVNGSAIMGSNNFVITMGSNWGETMKIRVLRDGKSVDLSVVPQYDEESGLGRIGVTLMDATYKKGFFGTMWSATKYTFMQVKLTLESLKQMFIGKMKVDVTGPIGIAMVTAEAAQQGFENIIMLIAILSISLGLINLMPVPILDGGWILFMLIELVRGKPLSQKTEFVFRVIGLVLILLLFVYAFYSDIVRIFTS